MRLLAMLLLFSAGLVVGRLTVDEVTHAQNPIPRSRASIEIGDTTLEYGMSKEEAVARFTGLYYMGGSSSARQFIWKKPPFKDGPLQAVGNARFNEMGLFYITKDWGSVDAGGDVEILWNAIMGVFSASVGPGTRPANVYVTSDIKPDYRRSTVTVELLGHAIDIERFESLREPKAISYSVSEDYAKYIGASLSGRP
jgi:hypothetical protein